jgi:hypothetical protein
VPLQAVDHPTAKRKGMEEMELRRLWLSGSSEAA